MPRVGRPLQQRRTLASDASDFQYDSPMQESDHRLFEASHASDASGIDAFMRCRILGKDDTLDLLNRVRRVSRQKTLFMKSPINRMPLSIFRLATANDPFSHGSSSSFYRLVQPREGGPNRAATRRC
jgi:hypothetical protein